MTINLTQHPATPEQVAAGVADLSEPLLGRLKAALTFERLPKPSRNMGCDCGSGGIAAHEPGDIEVAVKTIVDIAYEATKPDGTAAEYLERGRAANVASNEAWNEMQAMLDAHLAGKKVNLAEIGRLKVEHTRQARLSQENYDLSAQARRLGGTFMLGGAPFLMAPLVKALTEAGGRVVFAFSQRVSGEQRQPDGSVKKVAVFRHEGFVPA